jgi:hypothetical protein
LSRTPVVPTFECPICKKTVTAAQKEDAAHRPFCSERCKLVDLGRWLDGTYTISEPASAEDIRQAERETD